MFAANRSFFAALVLSTWWLFAAGCKPGASVPTANISADGSSISTVSHGKGGTVTKPVQLTADATSSDSPARAKLNLYPEVLIRTSLGNIRVKLNAEKAPLTVENFLQNYVETGFYDGTIFHYVDPGFMIAGGGFDAELNAKPVRTPVRNEAHHGLANSRGTIAMARQSESADSATSQFFFNLSDNTNLDHRSRDSDAEYGYCVFGEVVEGLDILDRIADEPARDAGEFSKLPETPVVIKTMQRLN